MSVYYWLQACPTVPTTLESELPLLLLLSEALSEEVPSAPFGGSTTTLRFGPGLRGVAVLGLFGAGVLRVGALDPLSLQWCLFFLTSSWIRLEQLCTSHSFVHRCFRGGCPGGCCCFLSEDRFRFLVRCGLLAGEGECESTLAVGV